MSTWGSTFNGRSQTSCKVGVELPMSTRFKPRGEMGGSTNVHVERERERCYHALTLWDYPFPVSPFLIILVFICIYNFCFICAMNTCTLLVSHSVLLRFRERIKREQERYPAQFLINKHIHTCSITRWTQNTLIDPSIWDSNYAIEYLSPSFSELMYTARKVSAYTCT